MSGCVVRMISGRVIEFPLSSCDIRSGLAEAMESRVLWVWSEPTGDLTINPFAVETIVDVGLNPYVG